MSYLHGKYYKLVHSTGTVGVLNSQIRLAHWTWNKLAMLALEAASLLVGCADCTKGLIENDLTWSSFPHPTHLPRAWPGVCASHLGWELWRLGLSSYLNFSTQPWQRRRSTPGGVCTLSTLWRPAGWLLCGRLGTADLTAHGLLFRGPWTHPGCQQPGGSYLPLFLGARHPFLRPRKGPLTSRRRTTFPEMGRRREHPLPRISGWGGS